MDERTPLVASESVISAVANRVRGPAPRAATSGSGPWPSRSVATRPGVNPNSPEGDDERPIGTGEYLGECLYGPAIRIGSTLEVPRECHVVVEGQVDHPVRSGRCTSQAVEIIERAAMDLCPGCVEGSGRGIRAGQADDLMASADELGNDG